MINIIVERGHEHKYSAQLDFSPSNFDFCQYLKSKYGPGEYNFSQGKWRFTRIDILTELIDKNPSDIVMDEETNINYQMVKSLLKPKEVDILNDLEVKNLKTSLYNYQKEGVLFFTLSGGKAYLADEMGCLTGDTKICCNINNKNRWYNLKNAYIGFNQLKKNKNHNWNSVAYLKSYNEDSGEFFKNKINKIIYSGKKEVYEVKAITDIGKKYSIKLTSNHPILTENGWRETGSLKVGNKILVNGRKIKYCSVCKENTEHVDYKYSKFIGSCKRCVYKFYRKNSVKTGKFYDKSGYVFLSGMFFHPFIEQGYNVREHRIIYEAKLNKLTVKDFKDRILKNKLNNLLFINPKEFEIHHLNGIKDDNRISNLELLTVHEHRVKEGKNNYSNLTPVIKPEKAKIISIKKLGVEDVYDIKMEAPWHNFIANGIVVHNCGKTLQVLSYIVHSNKKKSLVVCPAGVKWSWHDQVKQHTYLDATVIDSKSSIDDIGFTDITIINYDILKKFIDPICKANFELLVCDESHMIKSQKALRTKAIKKISKSIPSTIFLSGTPILSRPVELFTALNIIDPSTWNNWYSFTRKYCNGKETRWGYDVSGASNIEELQQRIKKYFLRRTKSQVLKDLPKKIFIDYPVQMSPTFQKEYNTAEEEFASYLKNYKNKQDKEIKKAMTAEALIKIMELRQITTRSKVEHTEELINNILENDEKMIVFSSYNEPLEKLHEKYKKISVLFTGKTNEEDKRQAVKSFQEDKNIKIFFGGTKSAGSGITLTAATNTIFIDYPWTPADYMQAQDRNHRPGNNAESVNVYQMYTKEGIDHFMNKLLTKKKEIFDHLIDGKAPEGKKKKKMINELTKQITLKYG